MIGKTFGHYRIEAQLGAGGMGVVYRARDERLERDVALKLLGERFLNDPDARRRLLNEARAASALNHPGICTIYDVGEAEGQSYIAMEYVPGQPLSRRIPEGGLPSETVVRYGAQIAAALAHAHERGIAHRDLKSANVVITPEGQAKVLDFGLAGRLRQEELAEVTRSVKSLETAREVAGTVPYMAPEVLRGEPSDARSDIWALGVVLYEMAAGMLPFHGKTGFELTSAIMSEPPPALAVSVPAGLRSVIQRCLAKEPGQRYQQAGEVRAALDALSSDVAIPAVGATAARPWWQRQFVFWAAALILFVGIGIWKGPALLNREAAKPAPTGKLTSTGAKASANQEADEYFERGMLFLTSQQDMERAQSMLKRAVELDPKFAEARGWYGFTHLLLIDSGISNDSRLIYKAEEELHRAIEDDPQAGHAYGHLEGVSFYRGHKEQIPDLARKALAIDPNDFDAKIWLANYYQLEGEPDRGIAIMRESLERQPLLTPARFLLSDLLRDRGDFDGAVREAQKILEQDPQNIYSILLLVRVYLEAQKPAEAQRVLDRAPAAFRANYQKRILEALALAVEGHRAEALRAMDPETLKYADVCPSFMSVVAEFYAVLGDKPKALEWLDKAFRNGDHRAEWFRKVSLLANIRQERGFQQILDAIAFQRQQRGK